MRTPWNSALFKHQINDFDSETITSPALVKNHEVDKGVEYAVS